MRIVGAFLAAVAAILLFTGCQSDGGYHVSVGSNPPPHEHVHKHKKPGPPPHAPAHGYRHKHADGCELRYDRVVGCYAVVGYTDYYYADGAFIRFSANGWEMSANIGTGWSAVDMTRVPRPLVAKYEGKGHGKKGKGKGNKHSQRMEAPILEARWGKY